MSETLKSVGLDIGTTSTQMILSELTVENRASAFSVPELEITGRKILYRSPVHFTPLLDAHRMDAAALGKLIEGEYLQAGITRESVDTGAVIITGETSRKENARTVLEALSGLAGEFVVTAAGPELESVLAAKGAGAVAWSEKTGKTVLHIDIGGGTSNLCLIQGGKIRDTGCLNVGGRLVKRDETGRITYVSPVLEGLFSQTPGEIGEPEALETLAARLTEALEMAAGLRPATGLLEQLTTAEMGRAWNPPEDACVLSFSGGVADCIEKDREDLAFGDIGPQLGRAIRKSRLCQGEYVLGRETIRATVIGAGCHSTQLSGSTVYHQNIPFPLKNLPVCRAENPGVLEQALSRQEDIGILALPGNPSPSYRETVALAEEVIAKTKGTRLLCIETDMAKALGQAMALRLPKETPLLCIDRVRLPEGSYLDIGAPVGDAVPVVVKTLVLGG